jgi:hypothetical protein
MKIRDLLVIIFTAIVALLVLGRAAHADGPCPMAGAGGDCPVAASSGAGGAPGSFPVQLVDWMCADSCASICRDRCVVACEATKDFSCIGACYPVCAGECYDECSGPLDVREPADYAADPIVLVRDVDGGAP